MKTAGGGRSSRPKALRASGGARGSAAGGSPGRPRPARRSRSGPPPASARPGQAPHTPAAGRSGRRRRRRFGGAGRGGRGGGGCCLLARSTWCHRSQAASAAAGHCGIARFWRGPPAPKTNKRGRMDPFPGAKTRSPRERRCQRVTSGGGACAIYGSGRPSPRPSPPPPPRSPTDCLTAPRAGPSPASPASPAAAAPGHAPRPREVAPSPKTPGKATNAAPAQPRRGPECSPQNSPHRQNTRGGGAGQQRPRRPQVARTHAQSCPGLPLPGAPQREKRGAAGRPREGARGRGGRPGLPGCGGTRGSACFRSRPGAASRPARPRLDPAGRPTLPPPVEAAEGRAGHPRRTQVPPGAPLSPHGPQETPVPGPALTRRERQRRLWPRSADGKHTRPLRRPGAGRPAARWALWPCLRGASRCRSRAGAAGAGALPREPPGLGDRAARASARPDFEESGRRPGAGRRSGPAAQLLQAGRGAQECGPPKGPPSPPPSPCGGEREAPGAREPGAEGEQAERSQGAAGASRGRAGRGLPFAGDPAGRGGSGERSGPRAPNAICTGGPRAAAAAAASEEKPALPGLGPGGSGSDDPELAQPSPWKTPGPFQRARSARARLGYLQHEKPERESPNLTRERSAFPRRASATSKVAFPAGTLRESQRAGSDSWRVAGSPDPRRPRASATSRAQSRPEGWRAGRATAGARDADSAPARPHPLIKQTFPREVSRSNGAQTAPINT
ncbi:collagen alpha-1(I) chain-like [Lepus europaeus]|uniref:collagen alpha-1(I) chain-like n=1 Tax=Lepus europaeus TaxID=9983 RepID=UPI002B45B283|nr:collagen alpha-1(I) chain-like [Lepus europaeus]